MAVVVAASDVDRFLELAARENLEATVVATVTENPRLRDALEREHHCGCEPENS